MKKVIKFLSVGLLMFSIVGCSCSKEEVVKSKLENSTQVSNKKLSTQEIYEYIRENDASSVNVWFLRGLMKDVLDISNNSTRKTIYELKLKERFENEVLNISDYKINGVFNEGLLVSHLKAKMYVIDTSKTLTSGVTYDLGLKYDYSDYIEKYFNYDIYLEMIKEDYISKNKVDLLDDSKTRIISVFTGDDLKDMEDIITKFTNGTYDNLAALEEIKKQEKREEIGRQYCENLGLVNDYYDSTSCAPSVSNTTYDGAINTFSICENGERCTLSEGLEYQIKVINETKYITEQVVNKDTKGILYEDALTQLLRPDVSSYLYELVEGEDKFLINGIYNHDNPEDFDPKHIILSEGHPKGEYEMGTSATRTNKYYLVTVRVIDSNTVSIKDKELAYSKLLEQVDDTAALLSYLKGLDVEVTDPNLKEYYNKLTGNK